MAWASKGFHSPAPHAAARARVSLTARSGPNVYRAVTQMHRHSTRRTAPACFTQRPRLAILQCVPSLGGNQGEQAGKLSRRQFARASVKAGMAASAAVWVAPQLSSVALAQTTAGSPPPSTTRPGGAGAGEPSGPGNPGQAAGGSPGLGGGGAPGAGGELPFTGADVRKLAVAGGAAVATGSALVAAERLSKRRRPRAAPAGEGPTDESGR
jgi:hypothetical protein